MFSICGSCEYINRTLQSGCPRGPGGAPPSAAAGAGSAAARRLRGGLPLLPVSRRKKACGAPTGAPQVHHRCTTRKGLSRDCVVHPQVHHRCTTGAPHGRVCRENVRCTTGAPQVHHTKDAFNWSLAARPLYKRSNSTRAVAFTRSTPSHAERARAREAEDPNSEAQDRDRAHARQARL